MMPRIRAFSACTMAAISSSGLSQNSGSVAPPTKLVIVNMPSGARPGKSDEFQTVPSVR